MATTTFEIHSLQRRQKHQLWAVNLEFVIHQLLAVLDSRIILGFVVISFNMQRTAVSTVSQILCRSNTTTSILRQTSSTSQLTALSRPYLSSTRIHSLSRRHVGPVRPYSSKSRNATPTSDTHTPLTDRVTSAASDAKNEAQNSLRREQEPAYQITFTCKPCGDRSSHRISKHGYHRGTVLIQCPACARRHVISDHLRIFLDTQSTLEEILAKEGEKVKKGYTRGDMEFWDDGTVTKGGGAI